MSKNCKLETHKKHAANIYKGRFPYSSREDVALAAKIVCSTYEDSHTASMAGALSKRVKLATGTESGTKDNDENDWILVTKTRRHKMPKDERSQVMKMNKGKSKITRDAKIGKRDSMTQTKKAMTKSKVIEVIVTDNKEAKKA
jgi:hypothetical protein